MLTFMLTLLSRCYLLRLISEQRTLAQWLVHDCNSNSVTGFIVSLFDTKHEAGLFCDRFSFVPATVTINKASCGRDVKLVPLASKS